MTVNVAVALPTVDIQLMFSCCLVIHTLSVVSANLNTMESCLTYLHVWFCLTYNSLTTCQPGYFRSLMNYYTPATLYDQLTNFFLIVHGSPLNLAKEPTSAAHLATAGASDSALLLTLCALQISILLLLLLLNLLIHFTMLQMTVLLQKNIDTDLL